MKWTILLSFIVSSFIGTAAGTTKTLAQCSCEPNLTLQEHFQRSDAVFVGKLIEATKIRQETANGYDVVIKFEVKRAWKRDLERFVTVIEHNGSTEGFAKGAEWLLYAFEDKTGTLQISRGCCSRTKPLPVAGRQGDLKGFEKIGARPKAILGN